MCRPLVVSCSVFWRVSSVTLLPQLSDTGAVPIRGSHDPLHGHGPRRTDVQRLRRRGLPIAESGEHSRRPGSNPAVRLNFIVAKIGGVFTEVSTLRYHWISDDNYLATISVIILNTPRKCPNP